MSALHPSAHFLHHFTKAKMANETSLSHWVGELVVSTVHAQRRLDAHLDAHLQTIRKRLDEHPLPPSLVALVIPSPIRISTAEIDLVLDIEQRRTTSAEIGFELLGRPASTFTQARFGSMLDESITLRIRVDTYDPEEARSEP